MSGEPAFARGPWLDWYVGADAAEGDDGDDGDGGSAVLVDDRVVVLSALGTTLVEAVAPEGSTAEHLAAVLDDVYGAPDGGDVLAATHEVLAALVAAGVLVERR